MEQGRKGRDVKDMTTINEHTWERQEAGWWTCSWGATSYGVCQENDGWYFYGPWPCDPRGPYRTMRLAMEQMLVAAKEQK